MKGNKSKHKTKSKSKAMPRAKQPAASHSRHKTTEPRISAAISIDEPLYTKALAKAKSHHENNFSRYVRTLVKRDLGVLN